MSCENCAGVVHLRPKVLAARWGVTTGHLANLRSEGKGPDFLLLGGRVAYRIADIEEYEERALVRQRKAA